MRSTWLTKAVKITGMVLGSIISILSIGYLVIYINMTKRIATAYDEVQPEPIHVRYDFVSIAAGARLVGTGACNDCHGSDFGGRLL